jgi:hypothetical protein
MMSEDEVFDFEEEGAFRMSEFQATKKEVMPLITYKLVYIAAIVVPPIIFGSKAMVKECKNSPHYISHIIFLVLQVILLGISTY